MKLTMENVTEGLHNASFSKPGYAATLEEFLDVSALEEEDRNDLQNIFTENTAYWRK